MFLQFSSPPSKLPNQEGSQINGDPRYGFAVPVTVPWAELDLDHVISAGQVEVTTGGRNGLFPGGLEREFCREFWKVWWGILLFSLCFFRSAVVFFGEIVIVTICHSSLRWQLGDVFARMGEVLCWRDDRLMP